ncbi:tRNA pseudouridine(54/55) synthase Pus10 [Candidatus Geothermarchaeota archaeon ex4572_27]|nr:MAG: tRNA pseudouridine(54/55) synthase Pus10 [Candidatus Geothermarchaeota archaeon ex4572_27]
MVRALARSGFKQAMKRLGVERPEPCYVCGGLMDGVQGLAARVAEALKPYEFNTFLVGTRVPGSIVEREDALRARFSLSYGESLKSDLNRELRRALAAKLHKKVDFNSPDVLVVVDLVDDKVEVKPSPVFIYGRYRKLEAGIPQNKWLCSRCWGAGCERCGWTGKMYPTSIEELVAAPMAEMFEGRGAKFHGAGREDVDVKVVGRGRPFVVEVKEPRRRFLDLSMVEAKVNEAAQGKVEVHELRYTNREEVRRLKMMAPLREKVYLARVKVHGGCTDEDLRRVEEALRGATIRQRTPTRVLHRRADKVRHKKVYDVEARRLAGDEVELKIRSQGGLYIKELITGDQGRTTPSVAEVLGREVEVEELTVVDVE